MSAISSISSYAPLINIDSSSGVGSAQSLLAEELSLASPGLLSAQDSTAVDLSGEGQLLSATSTFQDQLQALQPGTANSTGGQNYSTDFASLAAETQNFVDAFNNLQNSLTGIDNTSSLLGGNLSQVSGLTQALDAQVLTNVPNGSSTLTALSQLGITLNTSASGASSLSLNLNQLQSAFNTDATGAFSLLGNAAGAFNTLAGSIASQTGNQYSALATLAQYSGSASFLNALSGTTSSDSLNSLLAISALTGNSSGLQQVLYALDQYTLVSGLLA